MKSESVIKYIVKWLEQYCNQAKMDGFIIGISGGIDSAITSTLCAKTNKKVIAVSMPIHQKSDQLSRANEQLNWLKTNFSNVEILEVDLSNSFETLKQCLPVNAQNHFLSLANTRARLRMSTLYAIGQTNNLLVAGTGNKVEDFGVGFFTKYGDGGVDISPIADLTKTQVFELAKALNVINSIQVAKPTDGLWETDRTDEEQLGATYPELEWAMEYLNTGNSASVELNERQNEIIAIYQKFNRANKHKMEPIPVCHIPKELF